MAYKSNVLPKDAVYYKLTNASINNGIINFGQNGSVALDIDKTILTSIPASILFNTCVTSDMSMYAPALEIRLDIVMSDGSYKNTTVYHTGLAGDIMAITVGFEEGSYVSCKLTITSAVSCQLILWEMCPLQESDVTTIIEGVEQSLPKLLSDYNVSAMAVGQEPTSISLISCNLLANTDLQGHFLFNFTASEYCKVVVRILDNEMSELFCPLTYTVQPGLNSIGIPHAFLNRLAGYHLFVVNVQCTNGTLAIPVRGAMFTIDGGYLAERIINAGIDAMDLALHQPNIEGPDEIWLIGVDANVTTLRSRNYKAEAGVGWTPRYTFDNSIWSAIEFNGTWEEADNAYTLITDAYPVVAMVTTAGSLVVYTYDSDLGVYTEQTVLDSDVKMVSMCRGYSSNIYVDQDQGLVCAYLKSDGTVWYTHYAYSSLLGKTVWNTPVMLDDVDATHVSVNRLNDYRIGIAVTTPDMNKWYITKRTYVGQSIKAESVELSGAFSDTLFYMGPTTETFGSAKRLETPESIEVLPNPLYGEFPGPVRSRHGTDLRDMLTVYLDGVATESYTLYTDGGKLGATFDSLVGVRVVRIVFTNPDKDAIVDMSEGTHGWFAENFDFTWIQSMTYRQSASESISISGDISASVTYKPMIDYPTENTESVSITAGLVANVQSKELKEYSADNTEAVRFTGGLTGSLSMVQTGEQPI